MSDVYSSEDADALKEKQRVKREKELNDIRKVLSFAEGRRFVWKLMAHGKPDHANNGLDDYSRGVAEGMRLSSLYIKAQIEEAKPFFTYELAKENQYAKDGQLFNKEVIQ
jgi:hypothetical protein